jgi:hypothetical protein
MYVKTTGTPLDWKDPTAYNSDHFYTLEVGRETIKAGISDRLRKQVQRIVEDPTFLHYNVTTDFVRDAIVHLMHKRMEQLSDPLHRQEMEAELLEVRKAEATHNKVAMYHRVDSEASALIELWERALENDTEPDEDVLARTGEVMRQYRKMMRKDLFTKLRSLINLVRLTPMRAREYGIHLIHDDDQ